MRSAIEQLSPSHSGALASPVPTTELCDRYDLSFDDLNPGLGPHLGTLLLPRPSRSPDPASRRARDRGATRAE
ncbi:hypothetical protein [Streptomyces sp. 11x1]|uniref:hypothetical protein n=1 Tax=Streptomyces sp. 11x1 TaxID=3038642 RepID=UPI00292DAED5|nr:hypothetical protein [Streptomyces sp. 11x1]WNZ09384.1 hypothetical protein P8T65_18530 [Streptomyces sp. 11x1]